MEKTVSLSGNIRGRSGVVVELIDLNTDTRVDVIHSDKNGNWEFAKPSPGKYSIQFKGRGTNAEDTIHGVEVMGEPAEIDIDLSKIIQNRGSGDGVVKNTIKVNGRTEVISTTLSKINNDGKLASTGDIETITADNNFVTDNEKTGAGNAYSHLDAQGLKVGSAVGDAVKQGIIWADVVITRIAGTSLVLPDPIEEGQTGYMRKVMIPYYYDADDKYLVITAQMKGDNTTMEGFMRLSLYEADNGSYGSNLGNSTEVKVKSTTYLNKSTKLDVSGLSLTEGQMYYATLEAKSSILNDKVYILTAVLSTAGK